MEEYHYDAANQLTQIERDGQDWATATYDGAGRLTQRTVTDGSALELDYDGSGAPTRIRVDVPGAPEAGNTVAELARDGDGNPVTVDWTVAGDEPATGTTTLGWLPDTRGIPSVAALTTGDATTDLYRGAGGAILQTSTDTVVADVSRDVLDSVLGSDVLGLVGGAFDEFGQPTGTPAGTVVGLGYRGALTVAGVALMGARAYDATTGQFTATDPLPPVPGLAASSTPYPYVNNDPLNLIDPLGLRSVSDNAFSNAAWGAADGVTFGLSRFIRQSGWFGADTVDYTGFAYKAGMVTGAVTVTITASVATGGTATILLAGAYGGAVSANAVPAVFENRQASVGEIALGAGTGVLFAGGGLAVQSAFARIPVVTKLDEARALRDALGREMQALDRWKERPAVFIGAYDDVTGEVGAFHSVAGAEHAEEVARAAIPGARLTEPMGWRQPKGASEELWSVIPVCARVCQPKFSPELFPPGTPGQSGGAWGR